MRKIGISLCAVAVAMGTIAYFVSSIGCAPSDSSKLLPLESKVNIFFLELLERKGNIFFPEHYEHIILSGTTVDSYGSGRYSLDTKLDITNKKIICNIYGVRAFDGLAPSMICPAGFSKDLHDISGNFDLFIRYSNNEDSYKLSITKEEINIIPLATSFTQVENQLLLRIPDNIIWIECSNSYGDGNRESLCSQFHSDLVSLGATKVNLREGYYAHNKNLYYQYKDKFYKYLGKIDQLKLLANKFNNYRYLNIVIRTWQGDYFSNNGG